jgi:hypothetical protein
VRTASEPNGGRRPALLVGLALVAALVIGVGLFVTWDRVWRTAGPDNPGTQCPTVVKAGHRPPLAAVGVDRVMLIGDSIMEQPSCTIAAGLSNVGVETWRHAVSGSGLLNGSVDWVAATKRLLRAEHPDVVVAIFVGNYSQPYVHDAHGATIEPDTPAFFKAWQARAEKVSKLVRASGARMYWVSPPPIALPPLNHAQRLYDGYRTIERDHFLDAGRVLAGANGKEVLKLETCGAKKTVRTVIDGTHLTDDGARIYGQQIAHDLTAKLGVVTAPRPC